MFICNIYVTFVEWKRRLESSLCISPILKNSIGEQSPKVQNKIIKILDILENIECIPTKYLKHIESTDGLYEMRITLGSDIFRVFCFFDKGRLVVLLSGFQKKTQKTPKKEIDKAVRLMAQYYDDKKRR